MTKEALIYSELPRGTSDRLRLPWMAGGRATHGAVAEMAEGRAMQDAYMDIGGRATQDAYMDIGGRATQDAYMYIGGRATQEQLPSSCRAVAEKVA